MEENRVTEIIKEKTVAPPPSFLLKPNCLIAILKQYYRYRRWDYGCSH